MLAILMQEVNNWGNCGGEDVGDWLYGNSVVSALFFFYKPKRFWKIKSIDFFKMTCIIV